MLNVIHVAAGTTPVQPADVVTAANAVAAWVSGFYVDCFSSTVTVEGVHARAMEALDGPQFTVPLLVIGALAGDVLPYDVTLPAEFGTQTTGIAARGMFYPFPPTENENTSVGRPRDSYVTVVQARVSTLRTSLADANLPLIVASFTHYQYKLVEDVVVRAAWGSQRRRLTQYG
jgi:hypothetical protein